jgi:hypothetical protein
MRNRWHVCLVCTALATSGGLFGSGFIARADQIVLRSGGELEGVVIPDPLGREGIVGVLTDRTVTPLPLKQEQIARVIEKTGPLRDYVARLKTTQATAQAHFELGQWCQERGLPGPAEIQYLRAAEIDPKFVPAREQLGHVLVGDTWMTREEAREAQGLVSHNGRWVTPVEKDRRRTSEETSAQRLALTRRFQSLLSALKSDKPDVRRMAEVELSQVEEIEAVDPLIQVFAREFAQIRVLLYRTLERIEGREATSAIVAQYLIESDPALRAVALEILLRRPQAEVVPRLLLALRSKRPSQIGQAATALAELNAKETVPNLLAVLAPHRDRIVYVPVEVRSSGGPGLFAGQAVTYAAQAVPVTAPGAVAYNIVPGQVYDGVAVGNVGGSRIVPQARFVRDVFPNREVHEALVRLTGQDFGYDIVAWRRWLGSAKRSTLPGRIVPQP